MEESYYDPPLAPFATPPNFGLPSREVAAGGLLVDWPELMDCHLRYSARPSVAAAGWNDTLSIIRGHTNEIASIANFMHNDEQGINNLTIPYLI
eukprot:jgi/Botrbrau1/13626/Bobra.0373s0005.1